MVDEFLQVGRPHKQCRRIALDRYLDEDGHRRQFCRETEEACDVCSRQLHGERDEPAKRGGADWQTPQKRAGADPPPVPYASTATPTAASKQDPFAKPYTPAHGGYATPRLTPMVPSSPAYPSPSTPYLASPSSTSTTLARVLPSDRLASQDSSTPSPLASSPLAACRSQSKRHRREGGWYTFFSVHLSLLSMY